MRKLILQVQITDDGYIAGPNGEMDWMIFRGLDRKQNLTLVKSKSFDCGIVVLNYKPRRD